MSGEVKVKRTAGRPHSLRKAQAIRNVGKMIQEINELRAYFRN